MAYGILQIKSSKYAGWQILFLLEGGVTLAVAIAILFVLPMGLSSAWMLNEREKQHAVARVRADSIETFDEHGNYVEEHHKITMQNVKDAVTDWKKLIIIVCNRRLPIYALLVIANGYSLCDSSSLRFRNLPASHCSRHGFSWSPGQSDVREPIFGVSSPTVLYIQRH